MISSRTWLGLLALLWALTAGGVVAQEMDGVVKAGTAPCILRNDTSQKAREVGHLRSGDEVTVYMAISTSDFYFVKRKASPPGEGSGWITRGQVAIKAGTLVEPPVVSAEEKPASAVPAPAKVTTPNPALAKLAAAGAAVATPTHKKPVTTPPAHVAAPTPIDPSSVAAAESDRWDIPKGHWARSAVEELARCGLIRVPDGKFQGNKVVNRFEMAVLADRVMKHSDKSAEQLTEQLRKLDQQSGEARGQLSQVARRLDDVEGKVAKLGTTHLASAKAAQAPGSRSSDSIEREVVNLRQTFTRSIAGLALDRSKLDEYQASIASVSSRLESLEKRLPPTTAAGQS
ncbi:MAG: S-layer homology domain-containing protein [Candidatus Riflebacteria bacterium]|nr:S-layer homology domain-containing protein [Candidatus Riflebacteria bacterium]